jgi:hypothetical protein
MIRKWAVPHPQMRIREAAQVVAAQGKDVEHDQARRRLAPGLLPCTTKAAL